LSAGKSKLALVWSQRDAKGAAIGKEPRPADKGPILDLPTREVDRFELKYWVPSALCAEVLEYARPYLGLDPFNVKMGLERQFNTTLYLETAGLDSYRTHVDSAADRYKLRVRGYGEVPEGTAFFETKRKIKSITVKTRSAVAMS